MTSTRAVVFGSDPRTVDVRSFELAPLGATDVLVAAKVVGLCRSDNELLEGHLDAQLDIPDPVVPGHEWSGEVVAVGEAVTNVRPGDRVVGECVIAPNHWFGFTYQGAASEEFVVPANLLHRMPDAMTFEQGALVEPFTIAYNAFKVSGGSDAADVVVIVGGGMIGLCALAVAKANGSTTVVLEPSDLRRQLATKLGADLVLDPTSLDALAEIRSATGLDGADLVIEASGHPAGLASTVTLARFGGRITNIGICADDSVAAPWGLVQAKDLTVRGTTGSAGIWPAALRFLGRQDIDLTPVITARYHYEDAAAAMRATDDPANVKVHLTF
ncbi:MAG: zinc-binding dehydrogenase [Nocardioidaceae bacterium]|nr:zinc-binding dehydrogenase [Nocardioidaceae bacterium]